MKPLNRATSISLWALFLLCTIGNTGPWFNGGHLLSLLLIPALAATLPDSTRKETDHEACASSAVHRHDPTR